MTLVKNYGKTTALGFFVCVVHNWMTVLSTLPFLLQKKDIESNGQEFQQARKRKWYSGYFLPSGPVTLPACAEPVWLPLEEKTKSIPGLGMAPNWSARSLLKVTCFRVCFFIPARFWFALNRTPQRSVYCLCPYIDNTFWLRCPRAGNIRFKRRTLGADICYGPFQRAVRSRPNPGRAAGWLWELTEWQITWPQPPQP